MKTCCVKNNFYTTGFQLVRIYKKMLHQGKILKRLIALADLTQEEFATSTGISRPTLINYLRSSELKEDYLQKAAEVLKIDKSTFYEGFENTGNYAGIVGRNNSQVIGSGDCLAKLETANKEIDFLKQLIEQKDNAIRDKERIIELLSK